MVAPKFQTQFRLLHLPQVHHIFSIAILTQFDYPRTFSPVIMPPRAVHGIGSSLMQVVRWRTEPSQAEVAECTDEPSQTASGPTELDYHLARLSVGRAVLKALEGYEERPLSKRGLQDLEAPEEADEPPTQRARLQVEDPQQQEPQEMEVEPQEMEVEPQAAAEEAQEEEQTQEEETKAMETDVAIRKLLETDVIVPTAATDEDVDILEPPDEPVESVMDELAPDLPANGKLRWEPVNVQIIEEALSLDAVRRARLPHEEVFDVILSIRRRAVKVEGKLGWIPVLEREVPPIMGRKRRLYSGAVGILPHDLPKPIRAELERGVPVGLAGRSAFHFSRAVKYLVRGGLRMGEYDLSNALFEVLREDLPVPLLRYCDHREEILQGLSAYLGSLTQRTVDRAMCKKLMISIGFGGSLHGWMIKELGFYVAPTGEWRDFLKDAEEGMRLVRNTLAARHPDLLALFADRPFPKATLLYNVYECEERKLLDSMMKAAGKAGISPEHDGIGGQIGIYDVVAAAVDKPLTYKPYPQPYEELKARAPGLDWTLRAASTADNYADIMAKCRQYICEGTKAVRENAMTFARLVAMKMRASTNVPHADGERRTHFEVFDGELGFWMTRHRDDLASVISDTLCDVVRPIFRPRWERAQSLPDPPPPLNDGKFASSLCELVLGILSKQPPMRDLDGDHSRGVLLFSCGTVVDFEHGTMRKAVPEDRLGHQMGCTARSFDPMEDTPIFALLEAWVKEGNPSMRTSTIGMRAIDELKRLSEECKVLRLICTFAGSWEGVVWFLRAATRMATGNPRICEFLYIFGPGSSGKDVVMLLLLSFFGAKPHNYGCVLNGNFLVEGRAGSSKEGPSPFLASTAGKRFVWASEVPQHLNMNVETIKQFCEQSGAPITARKLYKAPISFRPVGVICATSNFPPQVTHKDDSGYTRRARIWQTAQTFSTKPSKLTEVKADPTIKQRIAAGEFNAELLWLVTGLVRTLTPEANPSTELEPKPQFMQDMEAECAEGGSKERFSEFIAKETVPCDRKTATPVKEFKAAVATALGISKAQVGILMTSQGYASDGIPNSRARVVAGFHPQRGQSKGDGIQLKK